MDGNSFGGFLTWCSEQMKQLKNKQNIIVLLLFFIIIIINNLFIYFKLLDMNGG